MKKLMRVLLVYIMIFFVVLAGCSANSRNEGAKTNQASEAVMDSAKSESGEKDASLYPGKKAKEEKTTGTANLETPSKMVIYQADLRLRVKKFEQTVRSLEEKAEKYGGYIAMSNVVKEGREQVSGSMTIRIPQKYFQSFLNDAEDQAAEVLQRNITGQDVSEEYVDLESRLKSKKVVEERLLSFMKGAAKTEDLLKISADLAAVQEEIETIEGKMKYLENQTSFSTININLHENKVVIPDIDKEKLNTWEKTKQQFMNSTNMLLAAFSGLVVFLVGNLPVLTLLFILGFAGLYIYKKRKSRNRHD